MAILLTGGTGYIGSHTAISLATRGYDVILLDNFVNSKPSVLERLEKILGFAPEFTEADLMDAAAVKAVFAEHDIDSVIHFAGLKAVGESVAKPREYYANNLTGTLNLLEAMDASGIKKLIFSSSATVYSEENEAPYHETDRMGATNPYGWSKVMIERMISDICAADPEWSAVLLRYFNPIGAHASGLIGDDPAGIPNNLMPYVARVASGQLDKIHIFGDDYDTPDGTGVRDYIHVMDLAEGHVLALEYIARNVSRSSGVGIGARAFNLGRGRGYSVKEVIAAFENVCGKKLPVVTDPRRAGDLDVCYADVTLAESELGFKAQRGLEEMCADSWRWQQYAAKTL